MRPDVVAFLDHPTRAVILSRVAVLLAPFVVAAIGWVMYRLERVDWSRMHREHMAAVRQMGTMTWGNR
jgi:hypothetical protein